MTNFETVQAINTALSKHQFTITQATDWPMFLAMGALLFFVFVGAWGMIIRLLIYGFRDIRDRISTQRAEDTGRCSDCKSAIWDHIDGPMWHAIKECCSSWSKTDQEQLRDSIKNHTGGAR